MSYIKLLFLFAIVTSCSWTRRQGIGFFGPVIDKGVKSSYSIHSWEYFKDAAPGTILFVESLLASAPENKVILTQSIKSHFAYGFGVHETLHWEEVYSEKEGKEDLQNALYHYAKAINYGKSYLEAEGLNLSKLKKLILAPQKIIQELDSYMEDEDAMAIFYFGASLSSSLNLQRNRADLLTLLPLGKSMIDWACQKNPNLEMGMCSLFEAIYLMSRSKMLGGNPQKGVTLLNQLSKSYPNNALPKIALLQYYTIPRDRSADFKKLSQELTSFFSFHKKRKSDFNLMMNQKESEKVFNLFNAIAEKRFSIMQKYQHKIF